MTDREMRARLGRGEEAKGYMIGSPLYQPGLTSLGARMPRDRGPDEGRELRAMAQLAAEQALLPDAQDWETSASGQRALAGASPQEQEYLLKNMAYVRQQVADALMRQQAQGR